jgi:hypothetical protein
LLAEGELFPGSLSILAKQPPKSKPTEEEEEEVELIDKPNPKKKHKPLKLGKVPKLADNQKARIESVGYSSNATEAEVALANRENERRAKALEKQRQKETNDKVLPKAREGLGRQSKARAVAVNLRPNNF